MEKKIKNALVSKTLNSEMRHRYLYLLKYFNKKGSSRQPWANFKRASPRRQFPLQSFV